MNLTKFPQVKIKASYCVRIYSALKQSQYKGLFIYDFSSSILYITDPVILIKIQEENLEYDFITNPNSIDYINEEGDDI